MTCLCLALPLPGVPQHFPPNWTSSWLKSPTPFNFSDCSIFVLFFPCYCQMWCVRLWQGSMGDKGQHWGVQWILLGAKWWAGAADPHPPNHAEKLMVPIHTLVLDWPGLNGAKVARTRRGFNHCQCALGCWGNGWAVISAKISVMSHIRLCSHCGKRWQCSGCVAWSLHISLTHEMANYGTVYNRLNNTCVIKLHLPGLRQFLGYEFTVGWCILFCIII